MNTQPRPADPEPLGVDRPEADSANAADGRKRRPPRPVRVARVLLAAAAVDHIVVPAVTLTHVPALRAAVRAAHPADDPAAITRAVDTLTATSLAVHLPLLILTAVLVWKLPTGHPWVLRPATVSQALSIVFSGLSSAPLPALHALFPVVDAVQLTVIVLLWGPRTSRDFFNAHPRSRRIRRLRAQPVP